MALFRGNNGNDAISGSASSDIIYGNGGDDRLWGLGGDDTLYGGTGTDLLSGGVGNDTYYVAEPGDQIVDDGGAADRVFLFSGWDLRNASGVEQVLLQDEAGAANVAGSAGGDSIVGNASGNLLQGGDGADKLRGVGGNDTLDGGLGDDQLYGGVGDDRLIAVSGHDTVQGGIGADTFYVDPAADGETVHLHFPDFNPEEGDRIVVAIGGAPQDIWEGSNTDGGPLAPGEAPSTIIEAYGATGNVFMHFDGHSYGIDPYIEWI
ncbi:calcium-binding protein [Azospirillum sp. ST 5-10]|uniref:calcium-binding protein n=1 Tax=unclassified Azospirillum TaxID=2630922 RepID=UPI003F49BB25